MNKNDKDDWRIQIEQQYRDESIYGRVTLNFEFNQNFELEYNQEQCRIENHYLQDGEIQLFIRPIDLNIDYYYKNEKDEEIKCDVQDYYLSDISDYDDSLQSQVEGSSKFYVPYVTISPGGKFLIICIEVSILGKYQTQRIIIIDLINQNIKKVFYRTHFIGCQKPYFSKDGNLGIINITKDTDISRFLFLNLQNGIQNEEIIQFDDIQIDSMVYDIQSGCLFYINQQGQIYQVPFNLKDFTIDKSNIQIYEVNLQIPEDYYPVKIQLAILGDQYALIADEFGQLIVINIRNKSKIIKQYNYEEYYFSQFVFNKAFAVISNYYQNQFQLINLSSGKLIRSIKQENQLNSIYQYSSKQSYLMSMIPYKVYKDENLEIDSPSEDNEEDVEKTIKWIVFDFIRGTHKEVKKENLTNKMIKTKIFTHDLIVQVYDNNIIYKKQIN
ncbi:unnamed protein product [Paramecium sonneborni]|uniref:Uncharacterized protein n=1 Tax=Paramecium sonneborni TaxID=65129 RepID=A0A8S1LFD4_9CILI|nr:unnamed protein product [Paramecium sonneborni]